MVRISSEHDKHEELNLNDIGEALNVSSSGSNMRLLECPKCSKRYVRNFDPNIIYADCSCGVRIRLKRRWYD